MVFLLVSFVTCSRWCAHPAAARSPSESDHRADGLAPVHEVESVVDLLERHDVRDQIVDVDLLVHVPIDDLRHIGAAARTTEGSALPHPSSDKLEGSRLDLLAGTGDADDDRHAPAAMAALERLAHE